MVERRFEPLPFILDADLIQNRLTLPIGRLHPQIGTLSVILAVWTLALIALGVQMILGKESLSLKDWGLMAILWLFHAFFLAGWWTGSETLRFDETHLEVAHEAFGLKRRRRFRLAEIHHVALEPSPLWVITTLLDLPFAIDRQFGSIGFNYRGRKVLLLPRLREAQAEVVAGWIMKHLPEHGPDKKRATE